MESGTSSYRLELQGRLADDKCVAALQTDSEFIVRDIRYLYPVNRRKPGHGDFLIVLEGGTAQAGLRLV